MAKKINFQIVTPEKVIFEDMIDSVTIPTQMGEITVLPNHIPLVSVLVAGELRLKKDNQEIPMAVSGGFIEVQKNKVVILADTAERVEEIDEKRAEEARVRAKDILKEKRVDSEEFASISAKIEKELARLKVVRKYRPRRETPFQT